jgi:competence protein ComEA
MSTTTPTRTRRGKPTASCGDVRGRAARLFPPPGSPAESPLEPPGENEFSGDAALLDGIPDKGGPPSGAGAAGKRARRAAAGRPGAADPGDARSGAGREEAPPAGGDAAPRKAPATGALILRRRDLWRLAVLERLPAAVRVRCGLELKSVTALTVLAVTAVAFGLHHLWAGRPQPVPVPRALPAARVAEPAAAPRRPARRAVVVDVAGKVHHPGVRRMPAGSRVSDALRAAGGPLPGTDTISLNLARVLADGEQLVVGAPAPAAPSPGDPAAPAGATGPISLNSATAGQLETLPGVGPVLAQHILTYRTTHGPFTSTTQLRDVTGIGPHRYNDLRPLVQP